MPAAAGASSNPIQEDGMSDSNHVMLTVLLHHAAYDFAPIAADLKKQRS